jgi:hypothetical protein
MEPLMRRKMNKFRIFCRENEEAKEENGKENIRLRFIIGYNVVLHVSYFVLNDLSMMVIFYGKKLTV